MINVTVLYPNVEGSTFDFEYYRDKHMPMVGDLLGAACKGITIVQGVAGAAPDSTPPYVAGCHLYFDSAADFQEAFTPHAETILGDIPNYSSVQPIVQISEVVRHDSVPQVLQTR